MIRDKEGEDGYRPYESTVATRITERELLELRQLRAALGGGK